MVAKTTNKKSLTICETGFGSGHSMSLFHEAAASASHTTHTGIDTRIVSFDKFDREYQLPLWHYMNETSTTGVHHEYYAGNSCNTVPKQLSSSSTSKNDRGRIQCDILHGSSLCQTDNIDLVENSPCGVLLTSTGKFRWCFWVSISLLRYSKLSSQRKLNLSFSFAMQL